MKGRFVIHFGQYSGRSFSNNFPRKQNSLPSIINALLDQCPQEHFMGIFDKAKKSKSFKIDFFLTISSFKDICGHRGQHKKMLLQIECRCHIQILGKIKKR